MAEYQLSAFDTVIRNSDGAHIPNDDQNKDRIAYNRWLADGGVPDPAAPQPDPEPLPGDVANQRLDAGIDAAADTVKGVTRLAMPPHSSPPTAEELQAQIDYLAGEMVTLADAVTAMLEAQAQTGA